MYRTAIILIVLVCASGCQSELNPAQRTPTGTVDPQLTDRSLLTDLPCAAPCWYGLQLGRSTRMDVLATLQTLPFIETSSIQESETTYMDPLEQVNVGASLISASCIQPEGYQCVGLVLVNDTLVTIGSLPHFSMTYREVVDHVGEPDFVRIGFGQRSGECDINLIWMGRQIVVSHSEYASNELCHEITVGGKMDPSLQVHGIDYLLANDPYLTSIPEPGMDFPWPGFEAP